MNFRKFIPIFLSVGIISTSLFSISAHTNAAGNNQNNHNTTFNSPLPSFLQPPNMEKHLTSREKIRLTDYTSNQTWITDNNSVASVDTTGLIIPKASGIAHICCINVLTGETLTWKVTVNLRIPAEGITFPQKKLTLEINKSKKIEATILPTNTTDKYVYWESNNDSIVSVDKDGTVHALSAGDVIITATINGKSESCSITVKKPKINEVILDGIRLKYFGNWDTGQQLIATIYPESADKENVKWKSSNTEVAKVDQQGKITPVNNGSCLIECISTENKEIKATCNVDVYNVKTISENTEEPAENTPAILVYNEELASTVIGEAEKYVGVLPYVWGGTNLTTGVDCSGFICAIYERFGYNLWGIRTDLYLAGTSVPDISQAQAGDILCYSGHVTIYDGNGGQIHAPYSGSMVRHDNWIGNYYAIRRILTE